MIRSLIWLILSMTSISAFAVPIIEIVIKDHLFLPSEIEIPVDTKVKLVFINKDSTAEELESYEMNREKVIPSNSKGIVFIGPLPAGEYPFFGEFFPKTAQGKVIVK
ncbi:MAG: cupredoxin domain-containing protein [Piscirickettsiaceae bacterium]|nr:cupredoxin domain-containing protein [Piscirickettsiaceae bacterium]